jgi:outer membrane protein insertion porin family
MTTDTAFAKVQARLSSRIRCSSCGVPKEYGLRASVFVDAGSVFGYGGPTTFPGSGQSLQVAGKNVVRSSVGAAPTWASPFGALTVNYAVPLSKAAYDVVQPLSFTAGGF